MNRYRKMLAAFTYQHHDMTDISMIYGIASAFLNFQKITYYEGVDALDSFIIDYTSAALPAGTITDILLFDLGFYGWFIVEYMLGTSIPYYDPSAVENLDENAPERYWYCSDIGGKLGNVTIYFDDRKMIFRDTASVFGMRPDEIMSSNGYFLPKFNHKCYDFSRKLNGDEKESLKRILSSMLHCSIHISFNFKSLSSRAISEFGVKMFEQLEKKDDELIRRAYSPALLYVNESKKRKLIKNGWSVDRISAYASIIKNELLPYKLSNKGTGNPPSLDDNIIATAYIIAKVKNGKFPIMQLSGAAKINQIIDADFIAYSATGFEWKKIIENYDIKSISWCYWWAFDMEKIDRKGYVTKHFKMRSELKKKGSSLSTIEKRMLTNIVGKLGCKPSIYKIEPTAAKSEWQKIKKASTDIKSRIYECPVEPIFLPAAVYINSYQRMEMLRIIEQNINYLLYVDTDGAIFEGWKKPVGFRQGKSLGLYECEKIHDIYIAGAKTYQYVDSNGELIQAAAGMNVFTDFTKLEPGEKVKIKIAQRCPGGCKIVEAEKVVIPIE